MVKRRILDQILKLDPQIDHVRIVHLDACFEFPFDFTRADEFAFTVPTRCPVLPICLTARVNSPRGLNDAMTIPS